MSANTITKPKSDTGLIGWITQYDSLVVFGGVGCLVVATIVYTGIFQAGPIVRNNLLFNALGGFALAFTFIWLIFKFMGTKITIFGKSIDFGMLVYVCIILFIVFIFGN